MGRGGFDEALADPAPIEREAKVFMVDHLGIPDLATRAAVRRLRRGESSQCLDLAFRGIKVYPCSRAVDHKGRHHYGDGRLIIATWR